MNASAAIHDSAHDPVFATPLDARSLIEASAGTGKTYALAGLFARAVIVGRLRVPQILAVTYTVAATQELHERVRLRLQRAAELAAKWRQGDADAVAGDKPDIALLRRLLHEALHDDSGESLPALRLRLQRAQREMDLAAITTIHGFCQRVLSEHALDTGQPLLAATLEPQTRAHRLRLATELWRESSTDAEGADFLRREFRDPDGLAKVLRDLLSPEPLLPPAPDTTASDPRPQLQGAWDAVRVAHAAHAAQATADLTDALGRKVLSGNKYRAATVEALWRWLQDAVRSAAPPTLLNDKLDKLTPAALRDGCNKGCDGREPQSPLFVAIAALLEIQAQYLTWRETDDLQRLHALRAAAFRRDAARKLADNVRDFDALVAAVHDAVTDAASGALLGAALRQQFPLALVDEFQDTDARQWAIFATVFGDGGLVLVGDPKQAIYRFRGGDVHTYLAARNATPSIGRLERNYRSRPGVLAAVEALFRNAPEHALGQGIAFLPTLPGDTVAEDAFVIDGEPAPALHFHRLPLPDNGKAWSKPESIHCAAHQCAAAIRDVLRLAQEGRATIRDRDGVRAVEARDCAVLVRAHDEAAAVHEALGEFGVPAVATGRRSLFSTDEAQELLTLLIAVSTPGDTRRLRAALATRLLGHDAAQLRALDDDNEALLRVQQNFDAWRMQWEQHGPQALLIQVVADNAARLLGQFEGERRLTQLLQLGELAQEARAGRLGTQGQIDWLRASIDAADAEDEQQWPRLESDAGRVQIRTLHASKGLEFPLVFLPFVGMGRGTHPNREFVVYQRGGERVRQWKTAHIVAVPSWKDATREADGEDAADDMRLLYVGLTRASHALWICNGPLAGNANSPLQWLLGGDALSPDAAGPLGHRLKTSAGPIVDPTPLATPSTERAPPPRTATRRLYRDWWIHSFSQLHRQKPHGAHALQEEAPATDERPLAATPASVFEAVDPRFRGERFGNAVHHALEHADFAAWEDHDAVAPPPGQRDVLAHALESQDYPPDSIDDGVHELTRLVAATLNAPLPEGGRLCDLPPSARVAEIEFHFTLVDADSAALLALLHAHGIATDRHDFGAWPRLSGLMNGKIDLTYLSGGRVHVLDYKSNLLADYEPSTLADAMRASEYDLQALLYVVALHRWLRVRRGAAYDYARDFGGVRYLFCRGVGRGDPGRGLIAPRFDAALVEAVDGLLAKGGAA